MTNTMPIRPMNDGEDEPINYPRANPLYFPQGLSQDARLVLDRFQSRPINFDVFDPKAKPPRGSYPTVTPFDLTDRIQAAIAELTCARMVHYDYHRGEHQLNAAKLHPEYAVAHGRGSSFIKISTFDESSHDSELLAVLVGADLESQDPRGHRMPQLVVRARHENGTDVEHDASSTAMFTIQNPTIPMFTGYGRMEIQGFLSAARFYRMGIDPLTADDGETRPGDHCTECVPPHPFVPYLPPVCTSINFPVFVKIEVFPLRPYLVAGA